MSEPTVSEMNIVSHIKRSSTGRTTMQISLSIELRCMLAKTARTHNLSQLSLIRCAISHYIQWLEGTQESGSQSGPLAQEPVPVAVPGAPIQNPGGTALIQTTVTEAESTVTPEIVSVLVTQEPMVPDSVMSPESEPPSPESEPTSPESEPTTVPESIPSRKRSRSKS